MKHKKNKNKVSIYVNDISINIIIYVLGFDF